MHSPPPPPNPKNWIDAPAQIFIFAITEALLQVTLRGALIRGCKLLQCTLRGAQLIKGAGLHSSSFWGATDTRVQHSGVSLILGPRLRHKGCWYNVTFCHFLVCAKIVYESLIMMIVTATWLYILLMTTSKWLDNDISNLTTETFWYNLAGVPLIVFATECPGAAKLRYSFCIAHSHTSGRVQTCLLPILISLGCKLIAICPV